MIEPTAFFLNETPDEQGWIQVGSSLESAPSHDVDQIRISCHVSGEKIKIAVPHGHAVPNADGIAQDPGATGLKIVSGSGLLPEFHEMELASIGVNYVAYALNVQRLVNDELKERLRAYATQLAVAKEEVALLRQKQFGTSSEQKVAANDSPQSPPAEEPQAESTTTAGTKKKSHSGGRKPLPEDLPRDDVHYDLPVHERSCPCCNQTMQEAGTEVSEQLTVIPAQYRVKRHIRRKYVCRACDKFVVAKGESGLLPGSSYGSAEVLAHVACQKFQLGLPFYRQEIIYRQAGLPFNRTTLANLMISASDKMTSLFEAMREHGLNQHALHADETWVQVLREAGRAAESKSYLWLYCSTASAQQPVVLFDYQETRHGDHAKRFLQMDDKQFRGYLHADGYAGYSKVIGVTRVGCMAHVRRKFCDVITQLPSDAKDSPAHVAIELIGQLYAIEQEISGLSKDERWRIRQLQSIPILDRLKAWLDQMKDKVTPKGLLGRAVGYALDQWVPVCRYTEDGDLAIDNNRAERQIKSVVIGRKNWLFADSPEGMRANAVMYSLVLTAKANGIDPYQYLLYVFRTMPTLKTAAEVAQLLPWNMPKADCHERASEQRLAA